MATDKLIEEKAKRYDEAIEKFDMILNLNTVKKSGTIFADDVRKILPELKESDDERMIQYFKDLAPFDKADELYEKYGFSHKDAISWLEKQGEHAKFRDSIQVGDKVTRNEDGVLVNLSQLNRVAKKQGEQKPADRIEPKFKVGDVIRLKGSSAEYTIKRVTDTTYYTDGWSCGIERCEEDYELIEQKPTWSEEDEDYYDAIIAKLEVTQDDASLTDNQMEFLKSLKDRFVPQSKQEWSDEDERIRIETIELLETANHPNKMHSNGKPLDFTENINWLKSLKERYTWKPSDEQMLAINTAINVIGKVTLSGKQLIELQEQLKKLRER